ncbi:MAG: hypothetical protein JO171_15040 [Paludibacterium sp.]|uniref:hypothetical protein n=1 Tax=Paludibacterium sp. TaxID=1917523 RepID=UPI0025E02014|nr:hypothetical protein [Paludibacterium sp.]MBV8048467.1 hypothetical protein [Paludibacterium sp.]MBV8646266.1 hypothetical protein [Paludibacterium sp.]
MTLFQRLLVAGGLVAVTGCASLHSSTAQTKMPELFCHDADWALAGLRDARVSFTSAKAVCAADRLKLAAQILVSSDGKTDLTRARSLVDSVLNGTEVQHDASLAGLAMLLDRQLNERRRADERADKLTGQLRDQQARIDDLNAKIAALTELEKSMSIRKRSNGQ